MGLFTKKSSQSPALLTRATNFFNTLFKRTRPQARAKEQFTGGTTTISHEQNPHHHKTHQVWKKLRAPDDLNQQKTTSLWYQKEFYIDPIEIEPDFIELKTALVEVFGGELLRLFAGNGQPKTRLVIDPHDQEHIYVHSKGVDVMEGWPTQPDIAAKDYNNFIDKLSTKKFTTFLKTFTRIVNTNLVLAEDDFKRQHLLLDKLGNAVNIDHDGILHDAIYPADELLRHRQQLIDGIYKREHRVVTLNYEPSVKDLENLPQVQDYQGQQWQVGDILTPDQKKLYKVEKYRSWVDEMAIPDEFIKNIFDHAIDAEQIKQTIMPLATYNRWRDQTCQLVLMRREAKIKKEFASKKFNAFLNTLLQDDLHKILNDTIDRVKALKYADTQKNKRPRYLDKYSNKQLARKIKDQFLAKVEQYAPHMTQIIANQLGIRRKNSLGHAIVNFIKNNPVAFPLSTFSLIAMVLLLATPLGPIIGVMTPAALLAHFLITSLINFFTPLFSSVLVTELVVGVSSGVAFITASIFAVAFSFSVGKLIEKAAIAIKNLIHPPVTPPVLPTVLHPQINVASDEIASETKNTLRFQKSLEQHYLQKQVASLPPSKVVVLVTVETLREKLNLLITLLESKGLYVDTLLPPEIIVKDNEITFDLHGLAINDTEGTLKNLLQETQSEFTADKITVNNYTVECMDLTTADAFLDSLSTASENMRHASEGWHPEN